MKCPRYKAATSTNSMEKGPASVAAAESNLLHLKASGKPEPTPIKPRCPPAEAAAVLVSVDSAGAAHDKENSATRVHDGTMDEGFEDSGYLSLQSSHIEDHQGDDVDDRFQGKLPPSTVAATRKEKTVSPKSSPSKCQRATNPCHRLSLVATTPSVGHHRRTAQHSISSTPSNQRSNLPILKFEQAVCEELSKSFQKNKRYDWSVVTKVAEDHLLDRVIGGQMGLEFVDVFSSLLSRNMRSILIDILDLLGDLDLISCKKVSRTWRRIICEDAAALERCQRAEQALRESSSSLRQQRCGLTRDVAASRVVLSCMQTLASSSTALTSSSSSFTSTPSCTVNRRAAPPQKSCAANSQHTRFDEYIQAASRLQQHESLRPCLRCGSPATHSPEMRRATCTRASCLHDFCTHCQEAFHGSAPCRVVRPRPHFSSSSKSAPLIAGSARSKKSIRRL